MPVELQILDNRPCSKPTNLRIGRCKILELTYPGVGGLGMEGVDVAIPEVRVHDAVDELCECVDV